MLCFKMPVLQSNNKFLQFVLKKDMITPPLPLVLKLPFGRPDASMPLVIALVPHVQFPYRSALVPLPSQETASGQHQ